MNELRKLWQSIAPYFVDVWQYLVFIILFIIAALIFLV